MAEAGELQVGAEVALLCDWPGVQPQTDGSLQLVRGQYGRVIEARDPAVVVVEFYPPDGAFALASVPVEHLLRLRFGRSADETSLAPPEQSASPG